MIAELLETPVPIMAIGRKRTQHAPRVLIEDNQVVIRTRCGLDPQSEGWTETYGYVTCPQCQGKP